MTKKPLTTLQQMDKTFNLMNKAYMTAKDDKTVLKLRQANDIFLDNLVKLLAPKTINDLLMKAMFDFYKKKKLKELD